MRGGAVERAAFADLLGERFFICFFFVIYLIFFCAIVYFVLLDRVKVTSGCVGVRHSFKGKQARASCIHARTLNRHSVRKEKQTARARTRVGVYVCCTLKSKLALRYTDLYCTYTTVTRGKVNKVGVYIYKSLNISVGCCISVTSSIHR